MVRKSPRPSAKNRGCHPRMDGLNRFTGHEPFVITYCPVTKSQEWRATSTQVISEGPHISHYHGESGVPAQSKHKLEYQLKPQCFVLVPRIDLLQLGRMLNDPLDREFARLSRWIFCCACLEYPRDG